MKKSFILAPVLLVTLTGCGFGSSYDETTLEISKKGAITQTIVEAWDQDFYDQDELEADIDEDLSAYGDTIELKKLNVKKGTATAVLHYSDSEAYTSYNGIELYIGSAADVPLDELTDLGFVDPDQAAVDQAELFSDEHSYKAVVVYEPVQVKVPGKIVAVSGNVEILGKKLVHVCENTVMSTKDSDVAETEETPEGSPAESSVVSDMGQETEHEAEKDTGALVLDQPACIIYK